MSLLLCLLVVLSVALLSLSSASADDSGRKPSVFQVGDDLMALPEVFSVLDFGANSTFAADEDVDGQMRLRSSRYWGRLYIDGWPQTIQYFRAHFGSEPPIGRKKFIFAEPRDGCTDITNADLTSDHILLVNRGTCTFGTKAKVAQRSAAGGVIIINNEPGLDHLPGPDAHDIQYPVLSMPQPEGLLLEAYYNNRHNPTLEGYLVPINCDDVGSKCDACTLAERNYIKNEMKSGGLLNIYLPGKDGQLAKSNEDNYEYLIAHFGTKMPPSTVQLEVVMAKPAEACTPLENDVQNKVVLVRRGKCSFVKKAEEVMAAGGQAMLVGSAGGLLVRMGVEPRWKGLSTTIPLAMVSKRVYSSLVTAAYTEGARVSFQDSSSVNSTFWYSLETLSNGDGWPRSDTYINKKRDELLSESAGWPDRIESIYEAYNKKMKITAPAAGEGDKVKIEKKSEL